MKIPIALLGVPLLVSASLAQSQAFNQLYNFQGGSDGGNPFANLVRDQAGNFYGTTYSGGNESSCAYPGCGVLFKVDSAGNETPLYTFAGPPADGANPVAGIVMDASGAFFGTTAYGGANNYGTVFEVNAAGAGKILHSFSGGSDGAIPNGGLIRDKAGNLYGTAYTGGAAGLGIVFKLTSAGAYSVLYSFPDNAHGAHPNAALALDHTGNLLGTTQYGGAANRGTVFRLDPSGNQAVLYSFTGMPDGAYPQSQLALAPSGAIYGTTTEGGASNNGTVFELTTTGTETILHNFGGPPDGSYPMAGVTLDAAGNLYGTTFKGGTAGNNGVGTAYKIDRSGNETVLYTFQGSFDGQSPAANLLLNGNATVAYGTTYSGGFNCCGVVYSVTLP